MLELQCEDELKNLQDESQFKKNDFFFRNECLKKDKNECLKKDKKVFCIHCANYYENQPEEEFQGSKVFTCTVKRTEQLADSPIKPAHVITKPVYDDAVKKNKNNDCQDFIPGLL